MGMMDRMIINCEALWTVIVPECPGSRFLQLTVKSDIINAATNKIIGAPPNFPAMFVYQEPVADTAYDSVRAVNLLWNQFLKEYRPLMENKIEILSGKVIELEDEIYNLQEQ